MKLTEHERRELGPLLEEFNRAQAAAKLAAAHLNIALRLIRPDFVSGKIKFDPAAGDFVEVVNPSE